MSTARQMLYTEKQRATHGKDIVLVLDSLNDPGNVGMIFRLADNFGAHSIYMSGKMLPNLTTKVHRSARHTHKFINNSYHKNTIEVIDKLKNEGYHVIAIELANTSMPINEFSFKNIKKVAIVMGGEEHGVHQEVLQNANVILHINMQGVSHTMNVANAATVALYHVINF